MPSGHRIWRRFQLNVKTVPGYFRNRAANLAVGAAEYDVFDLHEIGWTARYGLRPPARPVDIVRIPSPGFSTWTGVR